eukprot:TRINITY_DN20623_c0_g1_i1.p1 TRINITY_DN20623_c0_g1~~TRINITY_DN20623_c0_g1_i1.p1  ORF type:complete len:1005 (+),score=278.54 TRINITY_DN20623_c0_g1_i1:109-3123(+)
MALAAVFARPAAGKRAATGDGDRGSKTRRLSGGEAPVESLPGWAPPRTGLEKQFMRAKRDLADSLVMLEVGYKYQFFGRDADIAARVFGYYVHQAEDKAWRGCSFPTQRVKVNTARLVNLGYRVAHLTQEETAAIREERGAKGEFERTVTGVFTRATMILNDEAGGQTEAAGGVDDSQHNLLLLRADPLTAAEREAAPGHDVRVSLVSVSLHTGGAVVWDEFTDGQLRREVTTRLLKLDPVEVIVPAGLDPLTMSTVTALGVNLGVPVGADEAEAAAYRPSGTVRVETKTSGEWGEARTSQLVDAFFGGADRGQGQLPAGVRRCLGVLIAHLELFKLQGLLLRRPGELFERFSARGHMTLPGATLANLEVFDTADRSLRPAGAGRNSRVPGSLNWVINHCRTSFGARLLRHWLCRPLCAREAIVGRQDAVAEVCSGASRDALIEFRNKTLSSLPDLERLLAKVNYARAHPSEMLRLLTCVQQLTGRFRAFCGCGDDREETSPLDGPAKGLAASQLRALFEGIPVEKLCNAARDALGAFSAEAARGNSYGGLFSGSRAAAFPELVQLNETVAAEEQKLASHLAEVRRLLGLSGLDYKSISGVDYLIDVPVSQLKRVPKDWTEISRTKPSVRYHSPTCAGSSRAIRAAKDKLEAASRRCWEKFQRGFAEAHYEAFRGVASRLAELDCIFSLAAVAEEGGWVRPQIVDEQVVDITNGRHPVLDRLLREQGKSYVPNDTKIRSGLGEQVMIVTGPNMGGKSSYLRQTALIVLLAQVGCWVPAEAATLGVFDGIFVRLGAEDSLARGQSTFMVEMTETSDIIRRATQHSLVVLDELGRGTSTFDGVAIAYAVLEHLVHQAKCPTLFVTHYPALSRLSCIYPSRVRAFHMGFSHAAAPAGGAVEAPSDTAASVSFLFKLTPGVSPSSFGINVARLAGIPGSVLEVAARKSQQMERHLEERAECDRSLASVPAAMAVARAVVSLADGSLQREQFLDVVKQVDLAALIRSVA